MRRAWERVIPFFAFLLSICRVIYATNAIESINAFLCKIIETCGHFPSNDAAFTQICLPFRYKSADWGCGTMDWNDAVNQLAIPYFTKSAPGRQQARRLTMNTRLNRGVSGGRAGARSQQ